MYVHTYVYFFRKLKEIRNLIDIRLVGSSIALNDSAKIVLSIDISCELLRIPFNSQYGISHSSMKKNQYNKARKTLVKLLGYNKKLDVAGVMLKLGIRNEAVESLAKKIHATCLENADEFDDLDPQYWSSMSVYQACKLEKSGKVFKKNFIEISNLIPAVWKELEKKCDLWVSKMPTTTKETPKVAETAQTRIEEESKQTGETELEDYDEWAEKIITQSEAELAAMLTIKT